LTSAADVLEVFGIEPPARQKPTHPLLDLLPATADELVQATGLSAAEIAVALAELEVSGLAAEGEGTYRALA
jgi:predicted Rossmann fold nucleotide-binding protein DprA/Smf involved in DNA uptake